MRQYWSKKQAPLHPDQSQILDLVRPLLSDPIICNCLNIISALNAHTWGMT